MSWIHGRFSSRWRMMLRHNRPCIFLILMQCLLPLGTSETTQSYTQRTLVEHEVQTATISIVDGTNTWDQVTTVQVGDSVRISIDASASFAEFPAVGVTGCAAYDSNPVGSNENQTYRFSLIGDDGCNDAPSYYDPFKAAKKDSDDSSFGMALRSNATALSDKFKIFKFPGQDQVWIKCSLFFCVSPLDARCKHNCEENRKRRRRDLYGNYLVLETGQSSTVVLNVRDQDQSFQINVGVQKNVVVENPVEKNCAMWERYLTYITIFLSIILAGILFAYLKNRPERRKNLIDPDVSHQSVTTETFIETRAGAKEAPGLFLSSTNSAKTQLLMHQNRFRGFVHVLDPSSLKNSCIAINGDSLPLSALQNPDCVPPLLNNHLNKNKNRSGKKKRRKKKKQTNKQTNIEPPSLDSSNENSYHHQTDESTKNSDEQHSRSH